MTGIDCCLLAAAILMWAYLTDRRRWEVEKNTAEEQTPVGRMLAARRRGGDA